MGWLFNRTPRLQVMVGRRYRTVAGYITGPIRITDEAHAPFTDGRFSWDEDGKFVPFGCVSPEEPRNIVAEATAHDIATASALTGEPLALPAPEDR